MEGYSAVTPSGSPSSPEEIIVINYLNCQKTHRPVSSLRTTVDDLTNHCYPEFDGLKMRQQRDC